VPYVDPSDLPDHFSAFPDVTFEDRSVGENLRRYFYQKLSIRVFLNQNSKNYRIMNYGKGLDSRVLLHVSSPRGASWIRVANSDAGYKKGVFLIDARFSDTPGVLVKSAASE
jgi:hypothetical protein